jgi:hypothetical protein
MNSSRVRAGVLAIGLVGATAAGVMGCANPEPTPSSTTRTTSTSGLPHGVVRLKDFRAYVDVPAASAKLVVAGTMTVSSGRYVVKLVPATVKSADPRVLFLSFAVIEYPGTFAGAHVDRQVRFEAPPNYDRVVILGPNVDLLVKSGRVAIAS